MTELSNGGFTDGSTTTKKKILKLNGISVWSPDKDMGYSFETTYSKGSQRTQYGKALLVPLFTVEQYSYKATHVPLAEVTKILQIVAKGKKFTLHHYSLYHGAWRDDLFYVGKSGNLTIGKISDDGYLSELSFNMTGVNPL